MRLTTHLDWVQLMQMKAQGGTFNGDHFKSRLQKILPKKDLQDFLKRINQNYASGTSQQVQQQLSQINLIQPPLEASVPFSIEAPIHVFLRALLLCCGRQLLRIQAPCPCCSPPPAPLPRCPPSLLQQQQQKAGNFTTKYWAELARLQNKYMGDVKDFHEVTSPHSPLLMPLAAALPREYAPITCVMVLRVLVSFCRCSVGRRWPG